MNYKILITAAFATIFILSSCVDQEIKFDKENLELMNTIEISIGEEPDNTLSIAAKPLGGIAVLKNVGFDSGTINIELKGENKPGRSFVGIAFNIQNDSTYESVYFRPFNFNSKEKNGNSIQYVSHPKNTWSYLRTNFKGQYEAAYPKPPSADDWFGVSVKIDSDKVIVYDKKSKTELLSVGRLEKQVSDKLGLWTGNGSKGDFKNIKILK